MEKYIGTYKVFKVFRKSGRREIIARGLTREDAQALVSCYPDSNTSMVCFDKQVSSKKYFVNC